MYQPKTGIKCSCKRGIQRDIALRDCARRGVADMVAGREILKKAAWAGFGHGGFLEILQKQLCRIARPRQGEAGEASLMA